MFVLWSSVSSFPRKREPRDFSHLPPVRARASSGPPLSRGRRCEGVARLDYSLGRRCPPERKNRPERTALLGFLLCDKVRQLTEQPRRACGHRGHEGKRDKR